MAIKDIKKHILHLIFLILSCKIFAQTSISIVKIDTAGLLKWVASYPGHLIQLEIQKKVDTKWILIDNIGRDYIFPLESKFTTDLKDSLFIPLEIGENIFRIIMKYPTALTSKEVKVTRKSNYCTHTVTNNCIYFEKLTHFSIYDSYWNLIKEDEGKAINLTLLKNGLYYIYSDNRVCIYTKK